MLLRFLLLLSWGGIYNSSVAFGLSEPISTGDEFVGGGSDLLFTNSYSYWAHSNITVSAPTYDSRIVYRVKPRYNFPGCWIQCQGRSYISDTEYISFTLTSIQGSDEAFQASFI